MTEKEYDYFEEQDLKKEEAFFKHQFASFPCPTLPEALSAENIWEKICADEGDHQITVEPGSVEPLQEQERQTGAENADKRGELIEFPKKEQSKTKKVVSLPQRRRRLAMACTLVMVIGLSAAFWKLSDSAKSAPDLVANDSVKSEESQEEILFSEPMDAAPQMASAQEADAQEPVEDTLDQVMMEQETSDEDAEILMQSAPIPESEEQPQEEAATEEIALANEEVQTEGEPEAYSEEMNGMSAEKEMLRSSILESLNAEQAVQSSGNTVKSKSATPSSEEDTGEETEIAVEEMVEEFAEEEVEEVDLSEEPADEETESENAPKPKRIVNLPQKKKQVYQTKTLSVEYEPASGQVVLFNAGGKEQSTLQVQENAQISVSENMISAISPNVEADYVTLTIYSIKDAKNPKEIISTKNQGELFDSYQTGTDSYTVVTSVWFTAEQVDAGEFLPMVNDEELSPEQVNIIQGYGVAGKVNYLVTTTLSFDGVKTRADLYLK